MIRKSSHINNTDAVRYVIPDISNCFTWSFPEFIPFCVDLYYFSNFKDFNRFAQA
ncbi:hypothetical protein [Chitinophaga filiformis]|uniref:Uncharacterized protein n=1 Tax=Chitinophaga filiformis TaxID=104663 RepID=A0ABY4ICF5_CHIFI|nr:hypothetical protein [Chitinophaga filiformis]UPK72899.1 hypothetical protein MYF79_16535 [Chitinophaga filiformis]